MHPSRSKFLPYLKGKLGDVPVAMDDGHGIWENRKKAMLLTLDGDYSLVIQDDAIIGKNFYENVEREISAHPDQAYSFYFGNRKNMLDGARRALKNGGINMGWLSWGLAICLPTRIIPDLIKFGDGVSGYDRHDDTKIAQFLAKIKMNVWYPMPSLVDHRWQEKSLMENSEGVKKRVAFKFIGE